MHYQSRPPMHRPSPPPPPPPPPPEVLESAMATGEQPRCYFCGRAMAEEEIRKTDYHVGHGHSMLVMICPECRWLKEQGEGPWAVPPWRKPLGVGLLCVSALLIVSGILSIQAWSKRSDNQTAEWMAGKREFKDLETGPPAGIFMIMGGVFAGFAGLGLLFSKPRVKLPAVALIWIGLAGSLAGCRDSAPKPPGAPPSPFAGMPRFVNARANLSPTLLENYVDFSFSYPNGWELTNNGPSNPNFIRLTRKDDKGKSLEQFNVGWFKLNDGPEDRWERLRKSALALNDHLATQTNDYRKLSDGKTRFGKYDGYEFTFQQWIPNDQGITIKGGTDQLREMIDVRFTVRTVMIPDEGAAGNRGVTIMMYSMPGQESGNMSVIVDSFRLGKD